MAAKNLQHVAAGAAGWQGHREAHAALDPADLAGRHVHDPKLRPHSQRACQNVGSLPSSSQKETPHSHSSHQDPSANDQLAAAYGFHLAHITWCKAALQLSAAALWAAKMLRWPECTEAAWHLSSKICTLLRHEEEVAVSIAEARVVHGLVGGVHVDGVPLLICRAAQPQNFLHRSDVQRLSTVDGKVQACTAAAPHVCASCHAHGPQA